MRVLSPLLVLVSWSALGCSYHVYSPPARMLPLETVATLPVGVNALSLEGGGVSAVFEPSIVGGTARVRRGLEDNLDGHAEVSVLHVAGGDSDSHAARNAYALHAGVKLRVFPWLSLLAGAGAGGSAVGGFFSPDLGFVVAYENRYLVPFFSARGFVSEPILPHGVYLGDDDGTPRFGTPLITLGAAFTLGLRIPLRHVDVVPASLLLGVALTGLVDRVRSQGFTGPCVGLEFPL